MDPTGNSSRQVCSAYPNATKLTPSWSIWLLDYKLWWLSNQTKRDGIYLEVSCARYLTLISIDATYIFARRPLQVTFVQCLFVLARYLALVIHMCASSSALLSPFSLWDLVSYVVETLFLPVSEQLGFLIINPPTITVPFGWFSGSHHAILCFWS